MNPKPSSIIHHDDHYRVGLLAYCWVSMGHVGTSHGWLDGVYEMQDFMVNFFGYQNNTC